MSNKSPFVSVTLYFLLFINIPLFVSDVRAHEESDVSEVFDISLERLLNVTISTATKNDETVRQTPASAIVITRADIEVYGYSTLIDIFDHIVGMYQIDDYAWNGSQNYGVRGFFSTGHFNDMIILVNGVNQKESLYDSYNIAKISLPVELIEKIEVVRGPLSVTYGSGAFMGAINIITRDLGANAPVTNIVSAGYGSNDTYRVVGSVGGRTSDSFSYNVDMGYSDTDGMNHNWVDMVNDPSALTGFAGIPADATSKGQLSEQNLYLNGAFKVRSFSLNVNYVKTNKGVIALIPGLGKGIDDEIESITTTVSFDEVYANNIGLHAHVSSFYYTNDMTMRWSFANNDTFNLIDNRAYEIETSASFDITSQLDFLAGFNRYTQTKNLSGFEIPAFGLDRRFILPASSDVSLNAIFSNIGYQMSDNLRLSGGLRVEQLANFDMKVTSEGTTSTGEFTNDDINYLTNLAVIYAFDDIHLLKALYGNAIKQPAFGDSAELLLRPDLPQLDPAKIKTYELDYLGTFSNKFGISAKLFYNVLDNLITRENVSASGSVLTFSLNAGEQETVGLELGVKAEPVNDFHLDASVVFLDSKNKSPGFENIELGYSPRFLGYLKMAYLMSDKQSLSLTARYVGSMKAKWDVAPGADPSTGSRLGSDVDHYFPVDMNYRIQNLWNQGYFMNVMVTNIFDDEIRYPATKTTPFFSKGTLGPERRFMIRAGKKF
ncbi:MAG: TonB-dependent receptor plug domain-containing protein [Ectothiorhodospiraceae bacterium]|nr:TonB-dependent receptor plug domain-containing protein [Ectothiorhodospiraceae bacterium]